jgi:CheY-like chemotaxis protein
MLYNPDSELARDLGPHRLLGTIRQDDTLAVCAAIHRESGASRVVKVVLPGKTPGWAVRRFVGRARALEQMKHPALPIIFDLGRLPSGTAFVVTEPIEGESAGAWLRRVGRPGVPPAVAAAMLATIAEACAQLARRGVIHGNLGLDSLRLLPGREETAPFTIKLIGIEEAALRSRPPSDLCAEIHTLGQLFLELLTGEPAGASPLAGDPPGISLELRRLMRRMLAPAPASRYQSMEEIVTAVELILGRHRSRLGELLVVPGGRILVTPGENDVSADLTAVSAALSGDVTESWLMSTRAFMGRLRKAAHRFITVARGRPRKGVPPPTILIAEDDDDTRESLVELLEEHGYQVISARHGREAQEYLRNGQRAECMLMDLMMPEMDGWTLAAEMQQGRLPAIPTIVMTAADARRGYPGPIVVRKPFDSHHLLGLVQAMSAPATPAPGVKA